jgi:heptosyltransferase-3
MTRQILVIHQGSIGDLVLSFPALLSLRHDKNVSVGLLCSSGLGKIAYEQNLVDAYFSLESTRFVSLFHEEMTPSVKTFIDGYDTIILFSRSDGVEHHLRENHAGEVHRISPRPPVDEETHVALHLMRQFETKCLSMDPGTFRSIPPEAPSISPGLLQSSPRQNGLLIIHPGAGSPRKRWPVENFLQTARMIRELNCGEVAFVVGPAELDLAPVIKAESKGTFRVYEVDDLSHVMALLREARCFVGNDSGLTHVSAFVGTPTVAIFGPSCPKRWSPAGRATQVLRGATDCVPCFETVSVNCNDPKCLNEVSVNMVLDAVRKLVSCEGA